MNALADAMEHERWWVRWPATAIGAVVVALVWAGGIVLALALTAGVVLGLGYAFGVLK